MVTRTCLYACLILTSSGLAACQPAGTTTRQEAPDTSWVRPPEVAFSSSDYVFRLNQLTSFYDAPGEYGYFMEGKEYGFDSISLILTETLPGGGPPLHTHESEEAHVLRHGRVKYSMGDSSFTVEGPYILKVPAGVPHAFVNVGDTVLNLMGVLPTNSIESTTRVLGPNPLVKK